jgi:hypothetical protein
MLRVPSDAVVESHDQVPVDPVWNVQPVGDVVPVSKLSANAVGLPVNPATLTLLVTDPLPVAFVAVSDTLNEPAVE